MKAKSKSELAMAAGISVDTLKRWLEPHRKQLEALGMQANMRVLPPRWSPILWKPSVSTYNDVYLAEAGTEGMALTVCSDVLDDSFRLFEHPYRDYLNTSLRLSG